MRKNPRVCLTCSAGGHLHELLLAIEGLEFTDCYWVMYKSSHVKTFLADKRHYFVKNTDPYKKRTWVVNAVKSLLILIKERPDVIISTGAGISFPTMWLGKKFFGCKIIFISSAADVDHPARTPYHAYPISDLFLVQWEEMLKIFPKGKYIGVL